MFFEYGQRSKKYSKKKKNKKKKGQVFQTRRKNNFLKIQDRLYRRMSSEIPFKFSLQHSLKKFFVPFNCGSITIEASIVVPLFLLASIMLLSVIDMMNSYIIQEEKCYEQARQMAVYGSIGSPLTETDYIELTIPKVVHPPINGPGYQTFVMVNHCKVRIWNGYHGGDCNGEDESKGYAYVTKEGEVYHKKRDCSHLNLTINQINGATISKKRNEEGAKYYGCEYCAKGILKRDLFKYTFYVTPYGNRYHTSLLCSELKRTVEVVPMRVAKEKPLCKDCAKG